MRSQVIESVTIAQARKAIAQAVRVYFRKDRLGHYCMDRRRARPLCLMGPAGVGKTEIVRQVAEENGLAFLSYSITHHTRQSIIGLPRLVQGEVDGKPCSMTEYTMSEIIAQVHRVMAETGKTEGILFLDEFNCASESLRPIMLQLLQDKSFGPHPIPDGWMLVLAGNPTEYNRAASDLDAVTADRMRVLHIQPDYAAWRAYMERRDVHPVVLSYLDNHKDHFYVYRLDASGTALTTARGWEDLSIMLTELELAGETPDLALVAQYIQAGDVARSFFSYYTQYAAIISSGLVEKTLNREPAAVAAIRKMSFDRAWGMVSALLRHVQSQAEDALALDTTTAVAFEALSKIKAELAEHPDTELDQLLLKAAETMEDRPARQFLLDCVPLITKKGTMAALKAQFDQQLKEPRMKAYDQLASQISNLISVCRKALEDKPHLEFLFNGLCSSRAMTDILACSSDPQFRKLFQDISFDPTASARELENQLDQAVGASNL